MQTPKRQTFSCKSSYIASDFNWSSHQLTSYTYCATILKRPAMRAIPSLILWKGEPAPDETVDDSSNESVSSSGDVGSVVFIHPCLPYVGTYNEEQKIAYVLETKCKTETRYPLRLFYQFNLKFVTIMKCSN